MHYRPGTSVAKAVAAALPAFVVASAYSAAADAQTPAATPQGALEEVVVTARKRTEALIDVPLSISVVTPETIEVQGIQNITDMMAGKLPSLFYAQNRAFSSTRDFVSLVVRGVGANPALEPSTGVFIDGVYQPGLGFDTAFLDVERVELLRGPQGALFGRNTEGGALSIITRKPGNDVRGHVSVAADDLTTVLGRGSLSGPVVDEQLFAGVSVQAVGSDGYVRNTFLGTNQNADSATAARIALRYTPNERLEVNFTADDSTRRGKSMGVGIPESAGESFDVAFDFPSDFDTNYWGTALTIDYDFGGSRLTSQTAYRSVETQYTLDFDEGFTQQANFQIYNGSQQATSQEFRLASTGDGAFSWLGGVYLYRQRDRSSLVSNWGTFFGSPRADGINETGFEHEGYAAFGSLGYRAFGDFLDLTVSARYEYDDASATRFSRLTIPSLRLNTQRSTPREETFDNFSPSVQATFNWSPGFRSYINVATGWKTGGWERIPTSTSPFLTLQPESTINYEIGLKGGGDRATYTLAGYRVEIEDMHTPTLIRNPDTGFNAATIASAGKAHTQGVELDGTLRILDGLNLTAVASWTQAEFDEFTDTVGRNRAGDDIPNVPEWLFNLGLDYRRTLAANRTLVASGYVRHVGSYFSGLGTPTDPFMFYDSYEVVDLDIGLEYERFAIGLFVRNATDEYVITSKDFNSTNTFIVRQVGPPRTIGVRASFTFE